MTIVRVEDVLELLPENQRVRLTYEGYSVDADADALRNLLGAEAMRGVVTAITNGQTIDMLRVMAREDNT